ncbi:GtrA family protein [Micrococcales bacterium 31B]|nr:GtrA family protein [Micrococcales bacterium 31B]
MDVASAPLTPARASFAARLTALFREVVKFALVGGVAFIIDTGLFNLLRPDGALLDDKPLTAKIISASVATVFAWLGNRLWTYRKQRGRQALSEFVWFVVGNVLAMGIALLCLATSHYLLGYDSKLADNISANGVGLVLGTAFRWWFYRTIVFRGRPAA